MENLFSFIECFHTSLADIFPHEGTKAIGGSRMFIGGSFFAVLKDHVKSIRKALDNFSDMEAQQDLDLIWAEAASLLVRIEKQGQKGNAQEIDQAVMLLYLANGVGWNYLCEIVPNIPPHNSQYVTVEPMLPLLTRCGRKSQAGITATPKQLAKQLSAELHACLR